jgi:two-component system OmpR family sensor kinase
MFSASLGLSIVQTIAHRIGAEIRLDFADETQQTGLNVVVIVPMR